MTSFKVLFSIISIFRPLILAFMILMLSGGPLWSQLQINKTQTPQQLVNNVLIGTGVTVSNVTFSGNPDAIGRFNNGGFTVMNLDAGVILSTGDVADAPGPNTGITSTDNGTGSDPQLAALIPGYTINDAAVIEFDFIPIGDTLRFQYVFASEEYPNFVNSNYNDVFGFFVSGPNPAGGQYVHHNIALIPGTNLPVAIDNVNNGTANNGPCVNCNYYIDNTSTGTGGQTLEYNGLTTILTAEVVVTPCESYSFKIAIGDAGDAIYDSAVFLEENSFSADAVSISTESNVPGAGNTALEGCHEISIIARANQIRPNDYVIPIDTMFGAAVNGVDFPQIPDSIVIPAGHLSGEVVVAPYATGNIQGIRDFNLVIPTSVCSKDTVTVYIDDYMPIDLTTSPDTLICQDSVMLNVFASEGLPPYSYQWSPSVTLNNGTIANPVGTPSQSTTYVVTVSDTTDCPVVKDTVHVTVSPKPQVSFFPDPMEDCAPLTVDFDEMCSPNTTQWHWDFGDGNTSTTANPTHTFQNAGNYDIKLIATTDDGCSDSLLLTNVIKAFPQPVADFTADPEIASFNNPIIQFYDQSTGGASAWHWNFDDPLATDDTSNLQNPSYTYQGDGSFRVMLIAYSDEGCPDTTYKTIQVVVDEITIPNVITPNGDGVNDYFEIENIERLKTSRLLIYNRWGKKVYEAHNYRNDWDGDNHPDGVYYYILEYESYLQQETATGTVTILRE